MALSSLALCIVFFLAFGVESKLVTTIPLTTDHISSIPADATVKIGDLLSITCRYLTKEMKNEPRLCFSSNTSTVQCRNDGRSRLVYKSELLTILSFSFKSSSRTDHGTVFTCSDLPGSITLNLLYPPVIIADNSTLSNVTGYEGENVSITFTVEANPPITADDLLVTSNGEGGTAKTAVSISSHKVTVTFVNLYRTDTGRYLLRVNNSQGTDQASIQLTVYYGPVFTKSNATVLKLIGKNITLDCSISGSDPPLAIVISQRTTANVTSNVLYDGNSSIRITSAVTDNSGNYTCIATNGIRTNTLRYTLDIGDYPYATVSVNITYQAHPWPLLSLYSELTSEPDPSMTWYVTFLHTYRCQMPPWCSWGGPYLNCGSKRPFTPKEWHYGITLHPNPEYVLSTYGYSKYVGFLSFDAPLLDRTCFTLAINKTVVPLDSCHLVNNSSNIYLPNPYPFV